MAIKVFDRVKETSITSGSGTITLAGASTGFQSFGSVLSSGDQTYYTLVNGNNWEVGLGTYLNSSLARTTVLSSTNNNNLINLSGNTTAFIAYPAEVSVYRNLSRQVVADTGGILFNDGTILTSANVSVTGTLPTGGSVGQVLVKSGTGNYVSQWAAPSSIIPTGIDAANIANGTVSNTEFQYLDGVTSGIQSQLNLKANTASLTGYYSATNPSGFITTGNLSSYATTGQLSLYYLNSNPSGYATTASLTGYYSSTNPSGYITASALSPYYLASNPSGFITAATASGYYLNSNPSGYVNAAYVSGYQPLDADLTSLASASGTGVYYRSASNAWSLVTIAPPLNFTAGVLSASGLATSGDLNAYYPRTNPSGYAQTASLTGYYSATNPSGFITNSALSGYYPSNNPSGYATTASLTGYYSATNPSGFITNASLTGYYSVTNPSGYITSSSLAGYVPYVGATGNLNLGSNHLQAGSGIFSNSVRIGAYTLPTGDGLTGQVLTTNGVGVVTWTSVSGGSGGSGIASLNGLTNTAQVFSVSTTGVDFNINSAGSTHIFSIPDAGSGVRGVLNTGTQTITGDKSFDSSIYFTRSGSGIIGVSHLRVEGAQSVALFRNGTQYFQVGAGYVAVGTNSAYGFQSNASYGTSVDTALYWEATDTIGLRDSTNPQTFRIYNTYVSTGNYEAGQLSFASNEFRIGTIEAGPGTQRQIVFGQWSAQPTGTFNHVMSISPSGSCVQIGVQDTTYYRNRLVVTTDNTSTTIGNQSIADQGIYVGNSTNTINRPVGVQFGGQPGWAHCGIFGVMTNTGGNTGGDILLAMRVNGYSAGSLSPIARWYGPTAKVVFSGAADGTGGGNTTDTQYTFLVPNHINQISGVESPDVVFSLGSKTWASGNIPTQRFFRITAPTINNVGSGVITSGVTLSIAGPPVAGSGASITNPYALAVESGNSFFGGQVYITQGVLTSSAPVSISQTWNNASVVFTGIDVNITATAQNVSSNAMTLRQGSTNLVLVRAGSLDANTAGNSILQVCHPTSYGGHAVLGWRNPFQNGAGVCGDIFNSTSPPTLPSVVAGVIASSRVSTVPSFVITDGTNMAMFWADSGNFVSQRNGTNAQAFRITNTFTSTGNFEAAVIDWQTTPNTLRIGTTQAGAGAARPLQLVTSGVARVTIGSSGYVTIGGYTLPTGDGSLNQVLTTDGAGTVTWQTISSSGGGSGISSLNGLTNSVQTFSVSTTGVDFNINSSGSTHIFSIPDAGSGVRGVVSTGTQTIAGDKTFTGTLIGDANIFSNNTGGTATIGIRNGAGAGNRIQMTYGTGFQMASTYAVTWSPNSSNVNSPDVFLYRDAPGILANRNSTNAQMFRVANTFTSTGNFEAAVIDWQTTTNTLRIGTTQAGTGAARPLQLVTSGVARVTVSSSGSVTIGGYTLPTGDGALNQVLTTNGAGTVTWQTVSGSGGSLTGSPSGIVYFNAGGNATSDANLMWNSGTANLNIIGTLTATSKSFLIPHPTSSGKMLQYACLEGPENGVYVRGTTSFDFIDLPDYWSELVNDNITVSLTPVGQFQPLYVINKSKSRIVVGGVSGMYDYVVYGERKDIDKLVVEFGAE